MESQFISHRKWELHPQQLHRQSVQQVSWTHTRWKLPLSIGLESAYSTSWHHTHGQVVWWSVWHHRYSSRGGEVSFSFCRVGSAGYSVIWLSVWGHTVPTMTLLNTDHMMLWLYLLLFLQLCHSSVCVCVCVCSCRWQFVGLSKQKAEELLMLPHNQAGSFLIRESETYPGTLLALWFFYNLQQTIKLMIIRTINRLSYDFGNT